MKLSNKIIGLSMATIFSIAPLLQATPITQQYLNHYYNLSSLNTSISSDELITALDTTVGLDLTYDTKLSSVTGYEAIKMLVDASDFEELAHTYSTKKARNRLKNTYKINSTIDSKYVQYVAAALDTNIIDATKISNVSLKKNITDTDAYGLVLCALTTRGQGRNMIGHSNDPMIISNLYKTWNSVEIITDETLQTIGNEAVKSGLVTGYNILASKNDARFLPELTLRYGHSDIKHAAQLIGLLNSEEIVAKVQLEPKTSAYEYLIEWGPIPEASPQYEVREEATDFYITYAAEYDLVLEFSNIEDKTKFDTIITDYAKKNTSNPEGKALLHGSWWQPLYTSTIEMPNYEYITNNVINMGDKRLTTFALSENAENVKLGLEKLTNTPIAQIPTWVDAPFHRYLLGDFE
ncbi:MAG: hypothetical protein ACRCSG_01150 [Cellulosilyticaceae bacterium]